MWKLITGIIVIIGGIGVIASYLIGAIRNPSMASALWGGVSKNVIPYYVAGMILSAIGFLAYTYYFFFKVDADAVSFWPNLDFRFLIIIYLLVLVPSALWMTLTIRMAMNPSTGLEAGIRTVLILVAIGSLLMVISIATIKPKVLDWTYWLALVGSIFFFLHTAVLDATIWTMKFFSNYR